MARSFVARSLLPLCVVGLIGCSGCGGGGDGGGGTESPEFVSLGTAPQGGSFFTVGSAINDVLNDGKEIGGWRQSTAESTGGTLENLRRLDSGELQLAMANSSITYFAVRGEAGFDKKYEVQSVMTLFPLVAMFVTTPDSGIKSMADLKGKRVHIGPEGAGFEYFVRPILEEHGLKLEDIQERYASFPQAAGYLQDNSVDAAFLGGGLRATSITSAASQMEILLVPYDETARKQLIQKYPSFDAITVPSETYRGQAEPYAGLNVGSAHLLVRADADEEFVYNVCKIVYERREKIAQAHAAGKAINAKNVVKYTGTEFHPGAVKYYREAGIWPDDHSAAKPGTEEGKPAPADAEGKSNKESGK